MEFSIYTRQVNLSDRTKNQPNSNRIVFLGLMGEIDSILSECKKTRLEGSDNRTMIKEKLSQELGDSLWYITAIALKHDLDLRRDIVKSNIEFVTNLDICKPESKVLIDEFLDKLLNIDITMHFILHLRPSLRGRQYYENYCD
jgi:NTP pyrophosphatase (non-canonical NTP hydrolase)